MYTNVRAIIIITLPFNSPISSSLIENDKSINYCSNNNATMVVEMGISMKAGSSNYLDMHLETEIPLFQNLYIVGITFVAGLGGILFGYDTSVYHYYTYTKVMLHA